VIEGSTPVVIEEAPIVPTTNDQETKGIKRKYRCCQPKWCPPGLIKTKRRKLQHARHHQQKKEKLQKMREDIINATHPFFPPTTKNAARAAKPAKTG